MIPLKDDNPTEGRPVVTYFLIGICVLVFLMELGSQSYRTGELFYSYGLIQSVLMGYNQLPQDLYALPAYLTIFSSMFMHGGFMHLIGNMLYMWIFADNIEDNLGPVKFIIFYLLTAKHGHFLCLSEHITDETKFPLVSFCKTSSVSPLIKSSSIPNAGTLL